MTVSTLTPGRVALYAIGGLNAAKLVNNSLSLTVE